MAYNPLPIIALIAVSVAFQALLFGQELVAEEAPEVEEPTGFLDILGGIISSIFTVVAFIAQSIAWPFPEAWWPIRFIGGTIQTAGLSWAIATLVRGN